MQKPTPVSFLVVLVIPMYNEQKRFDQSLFCEYIEANPNAGCVLVNDGSTDATDNLIKHLVKKYPLRVYGLWQKNGGKASAVRNGMMYAHKNLDFEYAFYLDADFATPPAEVSYMLTFAKTFINNPDTVLFGSRIKRFGGNIQRKFTRHITGRVFATVVGLVFKIPVYDSQCGAKGFPKKYIKTAFEEPFLSKWIFDVEIILRLLFNNVNIIEVPLNHWIDDGNSRLKITDFLKAPFHLLTIKKHYFGQRNS